MTVRKKVSDYFRLDIHGNVVELHCRDCPRNGVPIAYCPAKVPTEVPYSLDDLPQFRTYEDIDEIGLQHVINVHGWDRERTQK